ncbi:MAG: hypothetical protein AB7T49_05865 [Oligoflexales bacterium]
MEAEYLSVQDMDYLSNQMNTKYSNFLRGRSFKISCDVGPRVIHATVTLTNGDESFFYPVEARLDYVEEELTKKSAALFLVDYIDVYFEEFLTEDEQVFLNIDWAKHQYDAVEFEIKGQILNLKLERLADDLLKSNESMLS